jgi:uncharacterized protein
LFILVGFSAITPICYEYELRAVVRKPFITEKKMNQHSNDTLARGGEMDLGLRNFMLGTYKYMIAAMAISGLAAWAMSLVLFQNGAPTDLYRIIHTGPLRWAMWLAPMGFVMIMGSRYNKMSVSGALFTLFGYAALIGVWLSDIAAYFAQENPLLGMKILLLSSSMFATFSLFGYMTRKNLSGIGQFAAMAFMGVIVSMVINMLVFKSTGFDMVVSGIGLVLVAAMTAWHTQGLKQMYRATVGNAAEAEKASVFGAISLYTSFINIFLLLMRFMGGGD